MDEYKDCIYTCMRLAVFQVGPGVVFLLFNHSFLGRGLIMHCVTPVEPLLQCVSHIMFYQSNVPPVVPKFILKAECIQVQYTLILYSHCDTVLHCLHVLCSGPPAAITPRNYQSFRTFMEICRHCYLLAVSSGFRVSLMSEIIVCICLLLCLWFNSASSLPPAVTPHSHGKGANSPH